MDFLSQVIDSIRVKWQKAQVRKDNLAVSTGCGSLVGGQIKHTRQEPQLSCDIIGIDRVKRVCKETFGRLEIAESQNEANLIGRCAEGGQERRKALREVEEPLSLCACESRRRFKRRVFLRCKDLYAWHLCPLLIP